MHPFHAWLLGLVEGVSEYLPISSTGHLILAAQGLRLTGEAVKRFEVVIQAGAIAAVVGLYRERVAAMARGLLGRDAAGRRLLINLGVSFLPAAMAGVALHHQIKQHLFAVWPVAAALAAGGALMIAVERWAMPRRPASLDALDAVTLRQALLIGLAQVLALWPGTSRSMVTIVAGMLVGLRRSAAAEYSFLLALPTLGAAAVFEAAGGAGLLVANIGWRAMGIGFVTAFVVAMAAMRWLVRYLNQRGLAPFGWYRLALATLVWCTTQLS